MLHSQSADCQDRFTFGANWTQFLKRLTPQRIEIAKQSLAGMLEESSLMGRRFLDVGCGSGLFSLAARELGAKVHSFDYDPQSVGCTLELKHLFRPDDADWTIGQGSALDENYMRALGQFDIVYSWGVLHHTGDMWRALDLVKIPCTSGGKLFIAIYNDQGGISQAWRLIKHGYNRVPAMLRFPYLLAVAIPFEGILFAVWVVRGRPLDYIRSWTEYSTSSLRGMSRWTDLVDWIGGYPFEVAKPEQIFDFFRARGFLLQRMTTCGGGLGCNEYVFRNA